MNAYVTELIVRERMAALRHEADQERLARDARAGRPARDAFIARLADHLRALVRVGPAHAAGQRVAD